MVEKSNSVGPPSPQGSSRNESQGNSEHRSRIKAKPMTFLGMKFNAEQSEKLWQVIIQNIGNEINKLKEKSLKALRRMRPDASPDDD